MRWQILGKLKSKEKNKRREEIFEIIFKNRGLTTVKQKKGFLNPPEPSSFSLKDLGISPFQMKKAVSRIREAITRKEEIIVYGDYDADGICATAILWETLNSLGAKAMPHIPDRATEGYGLNIESIKKLKLQKPGLGLIITVDQGITAHDKVDFARSIGIDVIITDHHQPTGKKPKAWAIVHTTSLCGAGVAWVLAHQLSRTKTEVLKKLELAAIGTITDLLALLGPNRSFVKWGFKELNQTRRAGLKALFKEAGIKKGKIGTYYVGFVIGPRLNAAGRIEHGLESLRLLCTKSRERALRLAKNLNEINLRRRKIMSKVALEAKGAWLAQKIKGAKIIFVDGCDWEPGVIGLAASKLLDEFYLPVIVVSRGKRHSRASARSVAGFNIIKAIREAENLLVDAGGHPMAAGFTVETKNLAKLKQKLIEIAEQRVDSRILEKTLKIDCEVNLEDLNLGFFNQLEKLAPFGIGNPQPDFVSFRVEVIDARLVGKENQHLKLVVRSSKSKVSFPAIAFGMGDVYSKLTPGTKIDLAYKLIADDWRGKGKLQLGVKDIKI